MRIPMPFYANLQSAIEKHDSIKRCITQSLFWKMFANRLKKKPPIFSNIDDNMNLVCYNTGPAVYLESYCIPAPGAVSSRHKDCAVIRLIIRVGWCIDEPFEKQYMFDVPAELIVTMKKEPIQVEFFKMEVDSWKDLYERKTQKLKKLEKEVKNLTILGLKKYRML